MLGDDHVVLSCWSIGGERRVPRFLLKISEGQIDFGGKNSNFVGRKMFLHHGSGRGGPGYQTTDRLSSRNCAMHDILEDGQEFSDTPSAVVC